MVQKKKSERKPRKFSRVHWGGKDLKNKKGLGENKTMRRQTNGKKKKGGELLFLMGREQ